MKYGHEQNIIRLTFPFYVCVLTMHYLCISIGSPAQRECRDAFRFTTVVCSSTELDCIICNWLKKPCPILSYTRTHIIQTILLINFIAATRAHAYADDRSDMHQFQRTEHDFCGIQVTKGTQCHFANSQFTKCIRKKTKKITSNPSRPVAKPDGPTNTHIPCYITNRMQL